MLPWLVPYCWLVVGLLGLLSMMLSPFDLSLYEGSLSFLASCLMCFMVGSLSPKGEVS